ncbi:hypothetical protein BV898_02736 [Hypsibius exemplaris]|uniref:Receptor ligand binding region domain-containing protein n=1 Tax=Hypsibius exemplaris TaxID=2072580 RepID=A0A1W0X6V0_HYPEX|nr:hypothetical protein BV898_02736 [Hypsibius exemplaris]
MVCYFALKRASLWVLLLRLLLVGAATGLRVNIVSPGFFSWRDSTSLSQLAPGILTGLDAIRRTYPQFNWTSEMLSTERLTDCPSLRDNIQYELSKWYYTKKYDGDEVLTVIITPGCFEVRLLNELAAAWDVLLITSMDYAEEMGNRNVYPSHVTTSPLSPENGIVYCALFAKMNWTKLYLLHDSSSTSYFIFQMTLLPSSLPKNCPIQLTSQRFASAAWNASQQLQLILQDFNSKSRVMLYLGNPFGLRKILIEAVKFNLLAGEHVFMALTPYDSPALFGNFTWQNDDSEDELMRLAYRAVLLIARADVRGPWYSSAAVRHLVPQWDQLTREKYDGPLPRPNLLLTALAAGHTAVELMAKAVYKSNPGGWVGRPPGGKLLADQLRNQSFDLQIGHVYILPQGQLDRENIASCFDFESGHFKTCLTSTSDKATARFLWKRVANVTWFDHNDFPFDEPKCGFDGHRDTDDCRRKDIHFRNVAIFASIIVMITLLIVIMGTRRQVRRQQIKHSTWWIVEFNTFAQKVNG